MNFKNPKIAIIGLGYVGLPLAVAFAEKFSVVGFDISLKRIDELRKCIDTTLEIESKHLKRVFASNRLKLAERGNKGLFFTTKVADISDCTIFIITVPTPTNKNKHPNLTPLIKASEIVAKVLKKDDVVIYESTVYPGLTEEEMVPILENLSSLRFNTDFFVGYSPERINPGDKERTVTNIVKVTSGSTHESARFIDNLYKEVVKAGTYLASSIKVAEAAKVIENSQRDINIAFVNELSKIFNLIGIDTLEVLEAAGTKWNFLPFKPGLVGGHCISVDPYYLAQKAQEVGYHPEIILAGRRLNDSMGKHVATEVIKHMMRKDLKVIESKVLILGITFKEDCPDVRNTRVIDIYEELLSFDMEVDVFDPWVNPEDVKQEYGIEVLSQPPIMNQYSAIILAVGHKNFLELDLKTSSDRVIYDVKGILEKENVDSRL